MLALVPKPRRIKKPAELKVKCWICGAGAADHLHYGEFSNQSIQLRYIVCFKEQFAATAAVPFSGDQGTETMCVWTKILSVRSRLITGILLCENYYSNSNSLHFQKAMQALPLHTLSGGGDAT